MRENTLQQWKNTMQQEGKLAVRTINRRLAVVNQYLHFMGGERGVAEYPAAAGDTRNKPFTAWGCIRLQAAKQPKAVVTFPS